MDLKEYLKNFDILLKKSFKPFKPLNSSCKVFHYTTLDAFDKILETRSLLQTSFKDLNDPTELNFGFDLFQKNIDYLRYRGCHQDFIKSHYNFIDVDRANRELAFFNFSCSSRPNLLGQWKGYGDQGAGVCFEIDLRQIRRANSMIGQVKYEKNWQVQYVEWLYLIFVEHLKKEYKSGKRIEEITYTRNFALALFQAQYAASTFMKHQGWEEESEIRYVSLIQPSSSEIFTLAGRDRVKTEISLSTISKVVWGPKADSQKISELKGKHKSFFDSTFETKSDIPWK